MALDLSTLTSDFAAALKAADARRPQASGRNGRLYQVGIGPHAEDHTVRLTIAELKLLNPVGYALIRTRVLYPGSKQACDLCIGPGPDWVIEIKMARPNGDNGRPDDTSIKDILSPYESDRSAVSDCLKLARAPFNGRKAILIYGFEDINGRRPLGVIIDAFETLTRAQLTRVGAFLEGRIVVPFNELVHPVFREGSVHAWEIRYGNT